MCQQLDDNVSIHIYLHQIDLTNQARSFFDLFADGMVEYIVLPAEGSFLVLGYLDQLGEFRGTYTDPTNP
jgi:hypothetical protein